MKAQIERLKNKGSELFKKAADIFESINLKKQAAQCLFTAQIFDRAAKIFEEIGYFS